MSKLIPLSRGLFATVDDADYEWLSVYRWFAHRQGRPHAAYPKFRAIRNNFGRANGKKTNAAVLMHREIMGAKKGQVIDHRNGNPLDNRRENLRLCTQVGNSLNGVAHADALSAYKGVSWSSQKNRWHARFRGKHLGFFTNEIDAARAYDAHVLKYEPEFARPNFPIMEAA